MSTGLLSTSSVQSAAPAQAPGAAANVSSSGDAKGFGTLYQQSLTSPSSAGPSQEQQTSASSAQRPAGKSSEAHDAERTAGAQRDSSEAAHRKAQRGTDTAAHRKQSHADEAETNAPSNGIIAAMAAAHTLANDSAQPPADAAKTPPRGLKAVDSPALRDQKQAHDAAQATVDPSRSDALQRSMAMQQLVDSPEASQNAAASATALKAAALHDARPEQDDSAELAPTATERSRQRLSASATAAQSTPRQELSAASREQHAQDGEDSRVASSRSQTDFSLQQALAQSSHSSDGVGSAHSGTLPPIDSSHWNQALASHISAMSRLDQSQATLTLAPASLGSLEVSLQMDRGQADVQFITHSRQAQDALSSSVNALHNALADRGIQLQSVSIVENHQDSGHQTSQQQHAFNSNASQQQSRQHAEQQAQEHSPRQQSASDATREESLQRTEATASDQRQGLRAKA